MEILNHIAQLFVYPKGNYNEIIDKLSSEFDDYGKPTADEFLKVTTHFTANLEAELQEYYIRTFDVNAECYLDIGYVLFGEESKRGQFLLNMKNEQLKANNDCGTEFPDHLPNFLTLLPKIDDALFREELVVTMLLPALSHIIKNFRTEGNVYKHLLNCLVFVLESTYKESAFVPYVINQREIECAGVYACGMDFTKLSNKKY